MELGNRNLKFHLIVGKNPSLFSFLLVMTLLFLGPWGLQSSHAMRKPSKIFQRSLAGGVPVNSAQSLKQCRIYYNKIGLAKLGVRKCAETAKRVSYSSSNFQACFKIYSVGTHAKEAPSTCAILTKKFQFQKNVPFQQCYLDQKKKMSQENAATACMNYVNNLNYLRGLSS